MIFSRYRVKRVCDVKNIQVEQKSLPRRSCSTSRAIIKEETIVTNLRKNSSVSARCAVRGARVRGCAVRGVRCAARGARCAVRGVRCAVWSAKLSFCGFCLWAERASQHRGVEGQCRSLDSWVLQLFWHMSTVLRLLSHALVRPKVSSAQCSFS